MGLEFSARKQPGCFAARDQASDGSSSRAALPAQFVGVFLLLAASWTGQADDIKPGVKPVGPLPPRDEQATFQLPKGFTIDLVAAEPDVVDPVALGFDENGRLFVAEMHAYPNAGVGTGLITSGKIKMLEDTDGDGNFDKTTLFADQLRLPNTVMAFGGGLLVSNPPEIWFLKDNDGDGKADQKRVLYSGFELDNIQQMVNGFHWGLDNWVYGVAGSKGGVIQSAEKPKAAPVVLRGRGIRFKPDQPASLEPMSGGGQFGLTMDAWGHWFSATNSQHLRQIVLPDHYLRRNADLPVSAVTLDIPDHGAACKVHRISPFEAWRVERTQRRKGGADSKRFSPTELVPGGFITSACSPLVYNAALFPAPYRGNVFVCDPANNLIHRDILEPSGAVYTAKRGDADCEFVASTDNWFRPVYLALGPDGAIYVADFYREVIETPLSLPEDMKKTLNLQSQKRGRIWRIRPEGAYQPRKPNLANASNKELVQHLADANLWWRLTAQRLLVQRRAMGAVQDLKKLAQEASFAPAVVHALWTLRGLKAFHPHMATRLTQMDEPGARIHALRLVEDYLKAVADEGDPTFDKVVFRNLAKDPSPQVRFQAAFSLHDFPLNINAILKRDLADPWTQTAVLSSINTPSKAATQLSLLAVEADKLGPAPALAKVVNRLSFILATSGADQDLAIALNVLARLEKQPKLQAAVVDGLGQGLQTRKLTLEKVIGKNDARLARFWEQFFAGVERTVHDEKRPLEDRVDAVALLGHGSFDLAAQALPPLLAPQQPQALQLAAIRALGQHGQAKVADLLLEPWSGYSPSVRREVLETLLARTDRIHVLLQHIEAKKVLAGQLEPARLDQLRKHKDPLIGAKAVKLLASQIAPARQKVVEAYEPALDLKGDAPRGKAAFKKICAACHRLEDVGVEVGADLLSVLANKTPERLLTDILDPSREVDPRFIEYLVTTTAGKVITGLIVAETASSVTLRRAEKVEDTILRSQIDSIQATAKSLMPEGLEMQLQRQDLADLIAYLRYLTAK